ncbi:MAG: glycosyltransferase [[Ruminococcus] torques]
MRIAMLTNNYRPFVGGVPISVERQAEELIKLGHQVTVFAPMYGETQEEREAVLAADVSAPEQVVRYGTQKRKMDNGMVYPSFYPSEIMEAFERDEFDCIHVHHPMFVGPCALYLKRKYRLPLIYTYHTRYEDYLHYIPGLRVDEKSFVLKKKAIGLIRTKIIPTYMSWFANQCDLVLAPSAGMQKILWEYGMRSRSAVFPTGLEKSFFAMDEQKAKEIRKTYK